MRKLYFVLALLLSSLYIFAGTYAYTKEVIARDQVLEKAHLYYRIHWYCTEDNAYGTSISNAECPYGTDYGWKDRVPYCWGGDDDIYEFLEKMDAGKGAGDKDTSSSSPYANGYVGSVDCSGYVSQIWQSGRHSSAAFGDESNGITTIIHWDDLAPGDAIDYPGHHIRLCEYYDRDTQKITIYEATSAYYDGVSWTIQHRTIDKSSSYEAIRYNYISRRPVIIAAYCSGLNQINVEWYGDCGTPNGDTSYGYKVFYSVDKNNWYSTNLIDYQTYSTTIKGLEPHIPYYLKVVAYATDGTYESNIAMVRIPELQPNGTDWTPPALIVNGFDRYIRDISSEPHSLVVKYGLALDYAGIDFDYVDNVYVTLEKINLNDYKMVFWMLGTESSIDHTFNHVEMDKVMTYLENGGKLFVSGSEVGYDLAHKEPVLNNLGRLDSDTNVTFNGFYNNYLKASYVSDGSNGNGYSATGVNGSIFEGLTINFDNGTHGTYNVGYPDKISANGGSSICLQYGDGSGAGIQYEGTFGNGTTPGKVVYFSFPFETIYPQSDANEIMKRIVNYFKDSNDTPENPTLLYVKQVSTNSAEIKWDAGYCDSIRIYTSSDASNWNLLATVSMPENSYTFQFSDITFVKITGVIGSNESTSTAVYFVKPAGGSKILLVDGFDRWKSKSSAVNDFSKYYEDSLENTPYGVDTCANEAIIKGDISLSDYDTIIYMLGDESTAQETFSKAEQDIVKNYLDNGGKLLVSGSEIGWDLEHKGDSEDKDFYNNYLKASYSADDAGTYSVVGTSWASDVGTFSFDNGSINYDVAYPDVITLQTGAQTLLTYSGGSDCAGLSYDGTYKLVYMAFPFETITESTKRAALMEDILDFFGLIDVSDWTLYTN